MRGLNKQLIVLIALLTLVAIPWPLERLRRAAQPDFEAWHSRAAALYECYPYERCAADFDGDGDKEGAYVLQRGGSAYGYVVFTNGWGELLRLPFYQAGLSRTRLAVRDTAGQAHLLVYDGAAFAPPRKEVYIYADGQLLSVRPTEDELRVLDQMAYVDDSALRHEAEERGFRDDVKWARMAATCLLLAVFAGVVLHERFR